MSAGRLAARGKPVIVLKVGRDAAPGADLVFDAAIRRAGMLRVYSTEDLFDAVETLARQRPQRGERLAVLTNGGGLGLIAADALACSGAQLAPLSTDTVSACCRPARRRPIRSTSWPMRRSSITPARWRRCCASRRPTRCCSCTRRPPWWRAI
jgi:hypothetical protein